MQKAFVAAQDGGRKKLGSIFPFILFKMLGIVIRVIKVQV